MAKETQQPETPAAVTLKSFAAVETATLPKRGRIARERTADELAMRAGLLSVMSADGKIGARDPEAYASDKLAKNAAQRYRSLIAFGDMPEDKTGLTLRTRVEQDGESFVLFLSLGKPNAPRKPKSA